MAFCQFQDFVEVQMESERVDIEDCSHHTGNDGYRLYRRRPPQDNGRTHTLRIRNVASECYFTEANAAQRAEHPPATTLTSFFEACTNLQWALKYGTAFSVFHKPLAIDVYNKLKNHITRPT